MRAAPLRLLLLLPLLVSMRDGWPRDAVPARGRVTTDREGFVRVPAARLEALGLGPAEAVRVSRRGRPVPAFPRPGSRDLVFLSLDPGTESSRFSVFELEVAPGGDAVVAGAASAEVPDPIPVPSRRTLSEDRLFGEVAAAEPEVYGATVPTGYLSRVTPGGRATVALDPAGAAAGRAQRLEAKIVATHPGAVVLAARWGEADLGEARAESGAGGGLLVWTVSPEAVPAGPAPLVLEDRSPPPPPPLPRDVSDDRGTVWIDEVALSGEVEPEAGARLLEVVLPISTGPVLSLRHAGAGAPLTAVVGPDGLPLPCPALSAAAGRVGLAIEGYPAGSRVLVAAEATEVEVAPAPPRADPLARAAGAEHVILATAPLVEAAKALAEHRTREGLRSVVVPVAEVTDAYAVGERDALAIRDFVLGLLARPEGPPRFLLLAGDATLDRTDLLPDETIPAPMARTIYNGATPADRLYGLAPDGGPTGGISIGRLPFREAGEMRAYAERVIAYETAPPRDATRRMLRFVTGEGRFGAMLDGFIENYFRNILAKHIPDAFDVEVTYARLDSPFGWPAPEFSSKVLDGLNEGALVYSYVGHGFAQGFDSIRAGPERHPILTVEDAPEVEVRGTPPAVLVLACTTGAFDLPSGVGIGEALIARPNGPIAYFGATRICHPAANGVLGRSIALRLFEDPARTRLGEILDAARDETLVPRALDPERGMIVGALKAFTGGQDLDRILLESSWMYGLLGDPAVRLALPPPDLEVSATATPVAVVATVRGPLADGDRVSVSVEVPRNEMLGAVAPVADPLDPASFENMRRNHAVANGKRVGGAEGPAKDGAAVVEVPIPEGTRRGPLRVKAWAITDAGPRVGSARVDLP